MTGDPCAKCIIIIRTYLYSHINSAGSLCRSVDILYIIISCTMLGAYFIVLILSSTSSDGLRGGGDGTRNVSCAPAADSPPGDAAAVFGRSRGGGENCRRDERDVRGGMMSTHNARTTPPPPARREREDGRDTTNNNNNNDNDNIIKDIARGECAERERRRRWWHNIICVRGRPRAPSVRCRTGGKERGKN